MKKTWVCERVGLVACAARKLPGTHRAEDLYQSALFKKARQWVIANCDNWFVLSAKHGLIHPSAEIDWYDVTLKNLTREERQAWADKVRLQLKAIVTSEVELIALAGESYCEPLMEFKVRRPLKGMGIGQQLHWLTVENY